MKKILAIIVLVVLSVGILLFAACGDKDEHEHDYGEWRIKSAATCKQDGVREKSCSICDHRITETIPATGHNYVGGICTDCGSKQ